MKAPKPYKARGHFQKVVKLERDNMFVMVPVSRWPDKSVEIPSRHGMTWHHSVFADEIAGRTIQIIRKGGKTVKDKQIIQTYYV